MLHCNCACEYQSYIYFKQIHDVGDVLRVMWIAIVDSIGIWIT